MQSQITQIKKVQLIKAGTYASNTDWMDFLNNDMVDEPEISPPIGNSNISSNRGVAKATRKGGNKKRKAGEITGADNYQDELDEEEEPNFTKYDQ